MREYVGSQECESVKEEGNKREGWKEQGAPPFVF